MPGPANTPLLLTVPNVSEGRDAATIAAIGDAYTGADGRVRLLDTHADADHHRAVHTLGGPPGGLAEALARGAQEAARLIDLTRDPGARRHPHVGALDVAPVVYLEDATQGAACAEALVAAHLIGTLGIPVLLYGVLAGGRTRAELRRGGPQELARRLLENELRPDFGPSRAHPTAGVTLVAARPPLVAFNLELAPPATLEDARAIAARLRASAPGGLPGLRAIGIELRRPGSAAIAQVSTNVEDHHRLPLAELLQAVGRLAPVDRCEQVGLAPAAAYAGFPADMPVDGRRTIEDAI